MFTYENKAKALACEVHLEEQYNSHQSRIMLLMTYWAQSSKVVNLSVFVAPIWISEQMIISRNCSYSIIHTWNLCLIPQTISFHGEKG